MKAIRLFSSDLDGTLAGDRAAALRFAAFWNQIEPIRRPLLVYNSGRLVDDMAQFIVAEGLPQPDFFIGGVGTMVAAPFHAHWTPRYAATVGSGYDAATVERILSPIPGISRQPARYQHAYKSSWYLHNADVGELAALEGALEAAGLLVTVVYSSNRDLDVIPRQADKGQALTWLCRELSIGLDEVVVAGDTGNDRGMFMLEGVRGVVPSNALMELKALTADNPHIFAAGSAMADGVVEGLRQWQVGSQASRTQSGPK